MSLFNELKRRNVFRVGAAYAIFAWVLIQIIDTVLPTFDAPRWIIQTVTFLIILGFPVTLFLAWIFELTPQGLKTDAAAQSEEAITHAREGDFARVKSQTLNAIIMGLMVMAVGFLLMDRFVIGDLSTETNTTATNSFIGPTQRVSMVLPPDRPVQFLSSNGRSLAISPDGRTVVYISAMEGGEANDDFASQLSLRSLDSREIRPLPGTEAAVQPFFSPDGQWIGFFTAYGTLKKIPLAGGRPITLLDDIEGGLFSFATWTDNDRIVFRTNSRETGLKSVSADGGEVTVLTEVGEQEGTNHDYPFAIPGTELVLFQSTRLIENEFVQSIETVDVATRERQRILDNASYPLYVADGNAGYLVFNQNEVKLVAPFDLITLEFTGQAVPVLDEMRRGGPTGNGSTDQLMVSRNGTLAYVPQVNSLLELFLISSDGNAEPLPIRADRYSLIQISADGRYAAFNVVNEVDNQIRLYDFSRGVSTRLTQLDQEQLVAWHPDSNALTIRAFDNGTTGLWLRGLDGSTRLLVDGGGADFIYRNGSWHPDGNRMVLTAQYAFDHDIVLLTVGDESIEDVTINPLLATSAPSEFSPRISADGQWLAYRSDKSGTSQVYVRRFGTNEELRVSTGRRGRQPIWSKNGTTLFFGQIPAGGTELDEVMASVSVQEVEGALEVGQPRTLFPLVQTSSQGNMQYVLRHNGGSGYDVLPDGRFLMARSQSGSFQNEIVLVQNWLNEYRDMDIME